MWTCGHNTLKCENPNVYKCIAPFLLLLHILESSVLVLAEAGLGSPRPTALRATTRNSYSTQAFRPTTVAVSVLPLITSGTAKKGQFVWEDHRENIEIRASLEPAERLIRVTRVCSLPAYGERGPGLDDITGDRAAIIPSGSPGQLGGAVCDLLHGYLVRRTWRTLFNHVMERINSGGSNIPGGPPSSNS